MSQSMQEKSSSMHPSVRNPDVRESSEVSRESDSSLSKTGEIERGILEKQERRENLPVSPTEVKPSVPSSTQASSQYSNIQQTVPPIATGQAVVQREIITTAVQQQPQMYHREHYRKIMEDPTIQLFNRLVAKDTHCLLGRTGVKVSRICLGSLNFGKLDSRFGDRPGQLDENEAHTILDRYAQLGGNCIDTADFFPWFGSSSGLSETIIGNWLKNREDRRNFFLITKVRMPMSPDNINSGGLSRSHIYESVNESLKRLQTNTIDLLLLNGWDPTVNIYETVRHLDELVKHDKVRYIGVCDFKGWQLQKFIDAAKVLNLHKCVCYMGEYNLLTRGCEWEVMDVCKNERIGFFAYSPFKYGFLTNQYTTSTNRPVEGSRIESASGEPNLAAMAEPFQEMKQNPIYNNVLNACERIGLRKNLTTAQIAILWSLQKGFVTSCVVGCNNVKELEENMSCLTGELVLSPDEMCELECASNFRLQYPYNINLSSVAGIKEIQPYWSAPFEQLSLMTQQVSLDQSRYNPSETLHEAKGQYFPEQESLRQPQFRAEHQRTIS